MADDYLADDVEVDYSVIRTSINMGHKVLDQILHGVHYGSGEIRGLLRDECDFIMECKVCRNLFRSLPNYVAHKRVYCRRLYVDMMSEMDITSVPLETETIVVQPEPVVPSSAKPAPSFVKKTKQAISGKDDSEVNMSIIDKVVNKTFEGKSSEYHLYTKQAEKVEKSKAQKQATNIKLTAIPTNSNAVLVTYSSEDLPTMDDSVNGAVDESLKESTQASSVKEGTLNASENVTSPKKVEEKVVKQTPIVASGSKSAIVISVVTKQKKSIGDICQELASTQAGNDSTVKSASIISPAKTSGRCRKSSPRRSVDSSIRRSKSPMEVDSSSSMVSENKNKSALDKGKLTEMDPMPTEVLMEICDMGKLWCKKCNKKFSTRGKLKLHVRFKHVGSLYECSSCEKTFVYFTSLADHLQIDHKKSETTIQQIKESYRLKNKLQMSMLTAKSNSGDKSTVPASSNPPAEGSKCMPRTGKFYEKCGKCDKGFWKKSSIVNHYKFCKGKKGSNSKEEIVAKKVEKVGKSGKKSDETVVTPSKNAAVTVQSKITEIIVHPPTKPAVTKTFVCNEKSRLVEVNQETKSGEEVVMSNKEYSPRKTSENPAMKVCQPPDLSSKLCFQNNVTKNSTDTRNGSKQVDGDEIISLSKQMESTSQGAVTNIRLFGRRSISSDRQLPVEKLKESLKAEHLSCDENDSIEQKGDLTEDDEKLEKKRELRKLEEKLAWQAFGKNVVAGKTTNDQKSNENDRRLGLRKDSDAKDKSTKQASAVYPSADVATRTNTAKTEMGEKAIAGKREKPSIVLPSSSSSTQSSSKMSEEWVKTSSPSSSVPSASLKSGKSPLKQLTPSASSKPGSKPSKTPVKVIVSGSAPNSSSVASPGPTSPMSASSSSDGYNSKFKMTVKEMAELVETASLTKFARERKNKAHSVLNAKNLKAQKSLQGVVKKPMKKQIRKRKVLIVKKVYGTRFSRYRNDDDTKDNEMKEGEEAKQRNSREKLRETTDKRSRQSSASVSPSGSIRSNSSYKLPKALKNLENSEGFVASRHNTGATADKRLVRGLIKQKNSEGFVVTASDGGTRPQRERSAESSDRQTLGDRMERAENRSDASKLLAVKEDAVNKRQARELAKLGNSAGFVVQPLVDVFGERRPRDHSRDCRSHMSDSSRDSSKERDRRRTLPIECKLPLTPREGEFLSGDLTISSENIDVKIKNETVQECLSGTETDSPRSLKQKSISDFFVSNSPNQKGRADKVKRMHAGSNNIVNKTSPVKSRAVADAVGDVSLARKVDSTENVISTNKDKTHPVLQAVVSAITIDGSKEVEGRTIFSTSPVTIGITAADVKSSLLQTKMDTPPVHRTRLSTGSIVFDSDLLKTSPKRLMEDGGHHMQVKPSGSGKTLVVPDKIRHKSEEGHVRRLDLDGKQKHVAQGNPITKSAQRTMAIKSLIAAESTLHQSQKEKMEMLHVYPLSTGVRQCNQCGKAFWKNHSYLEHKKKGPVKCRGSAKKRTLTQAVADSTDDQNDFVDNTGDQETVGSYNSNNNVSKRARMDEDGKNIKDEKDGETKESFKANNTTKTEFKTCNARNQKKVEETIVQQSPTFASGSKSPSLLHSLTKFGSQSSSHSSNNELDNTLFDDDSDLDTEFCGFSEEDVRAAELNQESIDENDTIINSDFLSSDDEELPSDTDSRKIDTEEKSKPSDGASPSEKGNMNQDKFKNIKHFFTFVIDADNPSKILCHSYKDLLKIIDVEKVKCLQCDTPCTNLSNLRRHAVNHLGWKRYKCLAESCAFICYDMSQIRLHSIRSHGQILSKSNLHQFVLDLKKEATRKNNERRMRSMRMKKSEKWINEDLYLKPRKIFKTSSERHRVSDIGSGSSSSDTVSMATVSGVEGSVSEQNDADSKSILYQARSSLMKALSK